MDLAARVAQVKELLSLEALDLGQCFIMFIVWRFLLIVFCCASMFCHQFSPAQGWFSALLLSAFMVKALMHLSYGPVSQLASHLQQLRNDPGTDLGEHFCCCCASWLVL